MSMMMGNSQYNFLFKVVIVGNSTVGKSSIVIRYADNEYSEVFMATIGVDFRFKSFPLKENSIKLQVWDTAGHERFRTITSSYYRGAHALMIVFDITNKQSFEDAIGYWFKQIKQSCPPQTQILLVGNKTDLEHKRTVTAQSIQTFLLNNPGVEYIQTSAKTSDKIEQAFLKIADMLIEEGKKSKEKKQPKKKRKNNQSEAQNDKINQTSKLEQKDFQKNKRIKRLCCT